jgi:hypothetical protein
MAGVEPASERLGPQKSTSLVGRCARFGAITQVIHERQETHPASRQGSKALFRMVSGVTCGTLTFSRLLYHRSASGAGRRDPQGVIATLSHLCSERKSSVRRGAIGTCFLR